MRRLRILVVDDEDDVRDLVAAVLVAEGHQIDTARNGVEALPLLEQHTYDLIVTDLKMPEIDGWALYYEVERRQPNAMKRFVFITGTTHLPEYAGFLESTGAPLLIKPFKIEDLRDALMRALSKT